MNAVRPLHIVSTLPHGFVGGGDLYTHPSGARVRKDARGFVLLKPITLGSPSTPTLDGYAITVDSTHDGEVDDALGKALELWREIGAVR
jgi:hypothetical protein